MKRPMNKRILLSSMFGLTLACIQVNAQENSEGVDWKEDVASRITMHGYAQGQYIATSADDKNSNTFLLKRTLLWGEAKITDRWSFLFMHDFNSEVQEYYTDYRVTKNKALSVRVGQFKTSLSHENALSPTILESIDVFSEGVTYLTGCGSDPLIGTQFGRDQGILLYGETNNKTLHYELNVVNGTGVNKKDKNNQKDVIGKVEVRPTSDLAIIATGQLGTGCAQVSNPIFNPTLNAGDNFKRNRWTAGFDYKAKSFSVRGEYLWGQDGSVHSRGAYASGTVRLATLPKTKALDFVWSYDYFNFNTTQKQDMHKVVAGLQFWFFKRCRFQAQYVYKNANTDYKTFFNGDDVHQLLCQMQVRFN